MTTNLRNAPVKTANLQNLPVMTANLRNSPVIKDDKYMSHIGHRTLGIPDRPSVSTYSKKLGMIFIAVRFHDATISKLV